MIQVVPNQLPSSYPANCPRPGCGTPTEVNAFGKLRMHKLPDGWRRCAASGATLLEAQAYDPPPGEARPIIVHLER